MEKIVGILGCTGTVGRFATEKLLRNGFRVIGGQRREPVLFKDEEKFEYFQVDINDAARLEEFCTKCDLVVSCISPACLYGSIVARAAAKCNATYLDATDVIMKEELPENGTYVIASGYVPGLCEFLPLAIKHRELDTAERLVIYSGGSEICSEAAFVDIILSAEGYADSCCRDGEMKPFRINIQKEHTLPYFERKVMLKPFLTYEALDLKNKLGIIDLFWFNTYHDSTILKMLFATYRKTIGKNKEEAANGIREVLREYVAANPQESSYALIGFEITGKKNGEDKIVRCCLFLRDSGRLCGYCLAETALYILNNELPKGVHMAYDIIDQGYLERLYDELDFGEHLYINEITSEEAIDPDRLDI